MRRVLAVLILVASWSCARGQRNGNPSASAATAELNRLHVALTPYYRVFLPVGTGRFPTVLFVSGCSGFEHPRAPEHYLQIAEQLRKQGRAVVFVDYVRAAGLSETCRGIMSPRQVGQYLLAAIAHIRALPFVDQREIDVIGWSLGGGGVLAALAALPNVSGATESGPGTIRAAVALYPDCSELVPWRGAVPTLLILAAKDAIQPPERCERVAALVQPADRIEVRVYAGAHHGFDMAGLPAEPVPGMPVLAFDSKSATAAWARIEGFLSLPHAAQHAP